jgi:CubicO group peptidase (beta-lactamase class C family)
MIQGFVHPDFGAVTEVLRKVTRHKLGGGGAVAVMHRGVPVVDAWVGPRNPAGDAWTRDTVAMSFSTTKGVVATAAHRLRDQGHIEYDAPVSTYWPEFAQAGKNSITVRHLLNHSAGMHRLRDVIPDAFTMLDWDATCAALAASPAAWTPGVRHGYHAITYGFLVGEVLRRVTGQTVTDVIRDTVVEPLGIDPLSMTVGRASDERDDLAELLMKLSGGLGSDRTLARLSRIRRLEPMLDAFIVPEFDTLLSDERAYDAEMPALNGCFTARALATMYSATIDGSGFLSPETFRLATEQQTTDRDAIVFFPMRWRLGYHMAATIKGVLPRGFGHFGFGGSGAWADPDSQLAVAFVCNRVAGSPFGDQRFLRLGAAALKAAKSR